MLPTTVSRLLIGASLLAALAACAAPARAADIPPLRSTQSPYFTADVAVTMDSLAHTAVSFTLTVPYAELSWGRVEGGYEAGAGFTVELDPEHGDQLYGASWEKRLLIASYDATHSSRNNLIVARSFAVPPGRYRVRVSVRDVSTDQQSDAQDQLVLDDLSRIPVGIADIQLGVVDSAGTFLPVPTRAFGYNVDHIAARFTAFDRRSGDWPRRAVIHYRILDDQNDVHVQGDTVLSLAQSMQSVVMLPGRAELFIGDYTLELERVEGKARWRATRGFEVDESGPPKGRAFAEILEALSYIAPAEEIDAMRKLPPDQQAAAWDRFWRRRDPTPDTPRNEFQIEFFRRLHYAEQNFQGFGPGWRSDMGRIYIRYGPPDQTEQHAATAATPQTEIWYYNQPNRRFVFVDQEGFGRFTLVQPTGE